uniref:Uncharacterized protein n=1 Tax=Romanomermis culicivorax TaxID=13658 RepID=A0A915JZG5_ROMCU
MYIDSEQLLICVRHQANIELQLFQAIDQLRREILRQKPPRAFGVFQHIKWMRQELEGQIFKTIEASRNA